MNKQPIIGRMLRDLLDDTQLPLILGDEFRNELMVVEKCEEDGEKKKSREFKSRLPILQINQISQQQESQLSTLYLQFLNKYDESQINDIIDHSNFIVQGRHSIWKCAFKYYLEYRQQQDNTILKYYSMVLLIPQLEHSLRNYFVKSNQLSDQFLWADYICFYTTLDLFLAKTLELNNSSLVPDSNINSLSTPQQQHLQIPTQTKSYSKYQSPKYSKLNNNNNKDNDQNINNNNNDEKKSEFIEFENKLVEIFGRGIMGLLLDLFIYSDSPRIRDRISHGEISPLAIPDSIFGLILVVSLGMCIKIDDQSLTQQKHHPIVKLLDQYQPIFHTQSILNNDGQDGNNNNLKLDQQQIELLSEYTNTIYKPLGVDMDSILMERTNNLDQIDSKINNQTVELNLYPLKFETDYVKNSRHCINNLTKLSLPNGRGYFGTSKTGKYGKILPKRFNKISNLIESTPNCLTSTDILTF
eukprot:gene2256-2779_t